MSAVEDLGTRQAWAVRSELRERALKAYGSYPRLAEAMGVPHKSVYRYLTEEGKDRVIPPLSFVVQLVELLRAERAGDDFPTFWAAATRDVR